MNNQSNRNRCIQSNSNKSLIWITNTPTYYRWQIWSSLNSKIEFTLLFLNAHEKNQVQISKNFSPEYRYHNLNLRQHYLIYGEAFYFGLKKILFLLLRYRKTNSFYLDGWVSPPFILSAVFVKIIKKQLIFGYRGTSKSHRFHNAFISLIRSKILNLADFIVTSGEESSKSVLQMGISQSKIIQLFNPVDVNWFHQKATNLGKVTTPGHNFLYVGQLIERKNISSLIQAFASIREPEDTLIIVGQGNLDYDLKKLSQNLNLQKNVRFLGAKSQEELTRIYAASHTLVLPSLKEVWGLVVNEALASGLHVVVSENCGVSEFIIQMEGAYICGTEPNQIASSMIKSRDQWKGHISSPEILQFTPEKFASKIIDLLDS